MKRSLIRSNVSVAAVFAVLSGCAAADPTNPLYSKVPSQPHASHTAAAEITPDANTIVLDHFNGATVGTAFGALAFAASDIGLGQAGVFGPGNYVKYTVSGACIGQGTVEMWIRPNTLPATIMGLLNVNWNNTGSYPPAGHVLHLQLYAPPGSVAAGGFWPSGSSTGITPIAAADWTHLALSWGSAGTKLYTNGVPLVGSPGGPCMFSPNYAYLNYWGTAAGGQEPFDGAIDEFHFSSVQRSDAEILQHATLTPTVITVVIDIKPGSSNNSINPKKKGRTPVEILTTADFDAATVDVGTVRFGATGTEAAPVHYALADVDGDSDLDLILHFDTPATGITCGATMAMLTGQTTGGVAIQGSDVISTPGCN